MKLSKIIWGTLTGLLLSLTNTKWTCASTIILLSFDINWFITNDVLVTDFIKDLIFKLSSRYADFLNSMLQDLTIINAPNFSLICKLLRPIVAKASVLALSRYFR